MAIATLLLLPLCIESQTATPCVIDCCADCDPWDKVGCASGLVCGTDNCAKFHAISKATGFSAKTDCCEGKRWGGSAGLWYPFERICKDDNCAVVRSRVLLVRCL